MRIVSLSDTHEQHRLIMVPEGDVLLHAGDFTHKGDVKSILDFAKWMGEQPHPIKIVIPGNHDILFEKDWNFAKALMGSSGAILLNQTTTKIGDLVVYGEPRQPEFYDWAFNVPREDMKRVWDMAPRHLDILLTHGPPMGAGDQASRDKRVGCEHQRNYILETKPKLVVCGHIHEAYGRYPLGSTEVINASNLNGQYRYTNPPIVVDL